MHCGPEVHEIFPVRHGDGFVAQLWFGVHETQPPLPSQTWFVPQLVPAGRFELSTQRGPRVQSTCPARQPGSGFVEHACPGVQPTHAPLLLQTEPASHTVPGGLSRLFEHHGPTLQLMRPV